MRQWCRDPHSGGVKIKPELYEVINEQLNAHAKKQKWHPQYQILLRFRGQFCYLDASKEGGRLFPIGRLRYFGPTEWTLGFYTYSNERYSPSVFRNGKWYGTFEDAVDICAFYLI